MKSVLLAYLHNEKICISRSFDIIDNKLIHVDDKSEYPSMKSIGLPGYLYNSKNNNDIFSVEWTVSKNDSGKLESYCINDEIKEKAYEIIEFDWCTNSQDVVNTLKEGFEYGIELSDVFFIKTGRTSTNAFEVLLCEKKYFSIDDNLVKLKDQYMGKPIVKLERRFIPKTDIISLINPNSEFDREFYLYTDLEKLRGAEYSFVNDGLDFMTDYFYQAIKNRNDAFDFSKEESQKFIENVRNVLKENDDLKCYLIDLGYPETYAEDMVANCEKAVESVILNNDQKCELIKKVIENSTEIHKKYYPLIEEKYIDQAKSKLLDYERDIQAKEEMINIISEEIKKLEKEKESINSEINQAQVRFSDINEEISKIGVDFEKKIKDYIETDSYLKKFFGESTLSLNANTATQTCAYKTIDFGNDIIKAKNDTMKALGIPQKDSIDFINCISNNLYKKRHFLIDSIYSEDFSKFLCFYIGKKAYDILYLDNQTTINEITNVISDAKKIVLVKNGLRIIDTSIIEYLSNNYLNITFVFEVDDVNNIKYYPRKIWNRVFYLYYGYRRGNTGNQNILTIPAPKEYFDFSSNIDMVAEAMNISVDDESVLGQNKVEITNQINSMYLYDQKFNYFYAPHISILLNSYGIDISELRLDDSDLEKYIIDLVKE